MEGLIPGLTKRGLALIAVTVLSLSALLPTVNSYIAQRQQLQALQTEVSQQKNDVESLQAEVDKWDDPTYVAAQARERLLFAMPGETQYRLTDTSGKELPMTQDQRRAQEAARKDWYTTLWGSVEGASVLRPADVPETPADTQDDPE